MFSQTKRRGSTSQMCLHKILTIITTVTPPLSAETPPLSSSENLESSPENDTIDENKASRFDTNSPQPKESLDSGLSSSATSCGAGGRGSAAHGGACFNVRNENRKEAEKSLTMLIEAAKLIFGEFSDKDESESGNCNELKKNEAAAAVEMGEEFQRTTSSAVVRSKRGRTQVLPCKYRDSVLEPLTRLSRPGSSIVPSKRRRR